MSLLSRIANVFRGDSLTRDIDEELQSHLDEAAACGRDPDEARRTFGSALRQREQSRDARLLPWLDSLRADAVFGWRQLMKRKVTSAAAILSLALAIGACTSAFRLIDAILLRPLPVASPERLYTVARQGVMPNGKPGSYDLWAYPCFRQMRTAVKGEAELVAASAPEATDLTYRSDPEMEKADVQFVSGWMFDTFGLRPALGRLFSETDDLKPAADPYAVLSYDYWTRRFARDPNVVGRTFRMGDILFQIVGVAPPAFTGTEVGSVTGIFIPIMMHPGAVHDDWTWHRTFAHLAPGAALEPVRARLDITARAFEEERAKGFTGMSRADRQKFIDHRVILEAANGSSGMQKDYRSALLAMGVLVALVLLIACANVANLMTAQAASRSREMAMRVSIGAGRGRLVQLVLMESAWLASLAALLGAWFAWWSAPFVVARINPSDNPVRLDLPADWRVLAFGMALTAFVTLLFGLAPALRSAGVNPAGALKGGTDPHARRRSMHFLIAAQVAFCFVVLFVANLFAATFERLSHRDTGFSAARVLNLAVVAQRPEAPVVWDQMADRLRNLPGVQTTAIAGWAVLTNDAWNGFVSVNGAPPGPVLAYFMKVSPGWVDAMKLPLIEGRDFRPADTFPGAAIVNETFVKEYFNGGSPLGKTFAKGTQSAVVVGVVRDAPYRSMHEPILPVAYVPFHLLDSKGGLSPVRNATFVVRTAAANPLALASTLRQAVPAIRSGFRVSNLRTQSEMVSAQTVRERLLAMLALFFASVALLLAAIGLYGVLDYSVLQRRREIGIRMAIGARAGHIARNVTGGVFAMVLLGALAGIALGIASARYLETLLYQVKPGDLSMLAIPAGTLLAASLLSAVPAVIRAVRIDPARTLRSD